MKSGRTGVARVIAAARYSVLGLKACWTTEAAFRQEIALTAVLVPLAFFVARTPEQWLLLISPLMLLLIVELLNSAIETLVDRIGQEHHELSGRAKDISSAAVFLCLVFTGLAWITIAWRNFLA